MKRLIALALASLGLSAHAATVRYEPSVPVLVDGDPNVHMADIGKVAAVLTRGVLLCPREVDQALGIVHFVQEAPQLKALH